MTQSILPPNLDYTDRDFDSMRARLYALIRSVFPTWTDFNVANFGNLLLELFAFVGDVTTFYQDNQAKEAFFFSATQRKNLIALAKRTNFQPATAAPATADETFTLATPPAADTTFPAGTVVKTADVTSPISYQLLADLTIPANANPPTAIATVENSESITDTFVSTGLPDQQFTLTSNPYIDDSADVSATDGAYTEVDTFLDSGSGDRVYMVSIDQNDIATLIFGDGINGKIPVGAITAGSKQGGGSIGNVEAGAIKIISGSFTDTLGNPVQASVFNEDKASGGTDRQTNAQIKLLAPAALRVTTRTVAREDFEINALKIAGVARALMTTSNEDPSVPENTGILYVVPAGGGPPSQSLKDSVKGQFISTVSHKAPFPSTLTFVVLVQDPLYLTVNVSMTVWFKPGVNPSTGGAAIRSTLAAFFAIQNDDGSPNTKVNFGYYNLDANNEPLGTMSYSQIFDAVEQVGEVLKIGGLPSDFLINGAHADLPILVRQFPQLGTVTIVNGIDGSLV